MNLAWLAAVLEPSDVVAAYDGDRDGPGRLAAVILGRHMPPADRDQDGVEDPVNIAQQCLVAATIATGICRVVALISEDRDLDTALTAALALIGCTAAVELDDYDTCFAILDVGLGRTIQESSSDSALIRAALLQQRALRLRDAGRSHLIASNEAALALTRVDIATCSEFSTAAHVGWSSLTTVRRMRDNLMSAVASLVPAEGARDYPAANDMAQDQRTRRVVSELEGRIAAQRASTYSVFVSQLFKEQFGPKETLVIGGIAPDLFHAALSLELFGHGAVYRARKELALLRLVQAEKDPVQLADALRVLRHAGARVELDLVLQRLQASGPLAVLSRDARQILRTRAAPELLRAVELQVLRVAAELMAPAEARLALDAVRASLTAGGPPNLPGTWQLLIMRKEVAWYAAVALANSCGASDEVRQMLLDEINNGPEDLEMLDRSISRVLAELDWKQIPSDVNERWKNHLEVLASRLPDTAEVVRRHVGGTDPHPQSGDLMTDLIRRLNYALAGKAHFELLVTDIPTVEVALEKIRDEARRGQYGFGGTEPSDVAASMIVLGVDQLWQEVAAFLLDPNVQRSDRTPAFERLARANIVIPTDVSEEFRHEGRNLLESADGIWDQSSLIPYPAALRFLGAYAMLSEEDTYDAIAALSGQGVRGRQEAARSIAVLASRRAQTAFLALALSLARDEDMDVRANAGRALALMANLHAPLATVAMRRVKELLNEDGLKAPFVVLRSLLEFPGGLPDSLRSQVEELAVDHPSRLVRSQAEALL